MAELNPDQIPENWSAGAAGYDESFARFTGMYAEEALRLTGVGSGTRVLDVAAGTGAFALRAARLGADVLATDFSSGMVDLLRGRFADEALASARAEVMDGQALAVDDGAFDVACSMFGVIFFPDFGAGIGELARAVSGGGTVCVATWNLSHFRLQDMVGAALARTLPGFEPPADPPSWAGLGDEDGLGRALGAGGLDDVVVHTVPRDWKLDDPAAFFRRLPEWAPPVQPLFAALDAETIDRAATHFVDVVAENTDGPDGVRVEALLGIGVAR